MIEQSTWSIFSSSSLAMDVVDFEDTGTVGDWGEATDM